MSENGTKIDQELLVCHVEGLEAYRCNKTPVSNIPSDLPQWKQDLLRKKEKEKIEIHRAEMARLYEESQTPEWMKPLKELHQRRKSEQSEKEEVESRKAEGERQRFEAMPAWKKQLIYKKRAKSAENLLAGRDVKSVNKSETNSECKVEEKSESISGEENSEVDAENVDGVNDGNENGISENEKRDEDITNDEVETPVDENEEGKQSNENGDIELEYTRNDGEPVEDLGKNEGEEIEVAEKIDEVGVDGDSDQQLGVSEEEKDNHDDELSKETPDSTGKESQTIPCDNENKGQCLEPDEDGTKETGEQQVEGSSEPAEVENNNEDKNGE